MKSFLYFTLKVGGALVLLNVIAFLVLMVLGVGVSFI